MKWVSVKDRLPSEECWVAVVSIYDGYEPDYGVALWRLGTPCFVEKDNDHWDYLGENRFILCELYHEDITHWMPLPLAPKE